MFSQVFSLLCSGGRGLQKFHKPAAEGGVPRSRAEVVSFESFEETGGDFRDAKGRPVYPHPGDRVVVRTTGGELLVKELARVTARSVELASLNRDGRDRALDLAEVVWIARIVWASQ